ncbi:MAG: hypothetical protein CVV42_14170 [Candidatus Riflebacteria bacterium HGW-Riflebacteria-2]|jgi:hypothetical protein|nr:MAG: hypothetical protein CVV42_14170 [Candidatus Riflebacteria bacterium HGW-Riflebacteria-2]
MAVFFGGGKKMRYVLIFLMMSFANVAFGAMPSSYYEEQISKSPDHFIGTCKYIQVERKDKFSEACLATFEADYIMDFPNRKIAKCERPKIFTGFFQRALPFVTPPPGGTKYHYPEVGYTYYVAISDGGSITALEDLMGKQKEYIIEHPESVSPGGFSPELKRIGEEGWALWRQQVQYKIKIAFLIIIIIIFAGFLIFFLIKARSKKSKATKDTGQDSEKPEKTENQE